VNPERLQYLRQDATLIGYDTDAFQNALANVQELIYQMSLNFPDGALKPWTPGEAAGNEGVSVSSNARYFTIGSNIQENAKTPFTKYSDPHGLLASLQSERVAHCFDNDVSYMAIENGGCVSGRSDPCSANPSADT
jgi:hypothetical protein